ncbi:MAG: nucleoside-diphosphate kinase [Gemmatimonadetes bacterium]|nr:nucleoside-diphosphate kinase [Gemmatimonadota bacterium]
MERTLAIIKPDVVSRSRIGKVLAHLEGAGFEVKEMRMERLSTAEARRFYEVHAGRPFYGSLVEFMTSGPCVPMVLEREDAISALRETIGATDPEEAEEGTVRRLYAESVERNAIHASDSPENAAREIDFFFGRSAPAGGAGSRDVGEREVLP